MHFLLLKCLNQAVWVNDIIYLWLLVTWNKFYKEKKHKKLQKPNSAHLELYVYTSKGTILCFNLTAKTIWSLKQTATCEKTSNCLGFKIWETYNWKCLDQCFQIQLHGENQNDQIYSAPWSILSWKPRQSNMKDRAHRAKMPIEH